jgi:hypothetical protein
MSTLYFADASSNPFGNSAPESNEPMLPLCLANRRVNGVFTSVSELAISQGITQGARYTLLFSPNNMYVFYTMSGGVYATTYGDYTWSLFDNFRPSAGGGQDTSSSVLSLTPTMRVRDQVAHPVAGEKVNGMVITSDRNVATFSSPLGIATFNIAPLGTAASGLGSRFRR